MIRKLLLGILITFLILQFIQGQNETYTVTLAPFSSEKYDEFSPVYYKNGIVFCTNRSPNLFFNYSGSQNKGQFKIYYIDTTGNADWQSAKLFSKNLKTKLNDGPVTFNSKGDTIYYSRNLMVNSNLTEISSPRNKLGIFYAVLVGGQWTKIREFRINNEWYNVTTPCLSPDGKKLFFASDKPGGFGGSDLYYCQLKGDYWSDPVNLGPAINTSGNESYPFINPSGDLFFSSDGQPGLGGKDIFFSRFSDTTWLAPVRLDPPINSQYDDFGIITDTLMNSGYFSSNRNKSIDIFHFKTNYPQIFYTIIQRENQYCFLFDDHGSILVDSANLQYKWYFGDGKSASKPVVNHCYQGPGHYDVRLDIIDRSTGDLFFTKLLYNLELRDFEQPYINSSNVVIKGETVEFDGLKSYLPGNEILHYSWNFGDGSRSVGPNVKHSFQKKGEYNVNLELTLKLGSTGNIHKTGVSKKILVLTDPQERTSIQVKQSPVKTPSPDIRNTENAKINTQYSAETELQQDAVFTVEILSSKTRIGLNNGIFRNVPKRYTLKEDFNPDDGIYRYVVDQQMNLMATYQDYREMRSVGFKDTRVIVHLLKDPYEKELYKLIKNYGVFADSYFDSSDRLTSDAYIMLDQVYKLMNNYPTLRLEVAVHSDNTGSAENSLSLSQKRSQILVNYLIKRGISIKRLVATGYGGSRPIAPNFQDKDRKLNRRVDFIILN
jgi:outer membrane protein OmpA-like peptidoglycan-associated protein